MAREWLEFSNFWAESLFRKSNLCAFVYASKMLKFLTQSLYKESHSGNRSGNYKNQVLWREY